MPEKTKDIPLLNNGEFKVEKVVELNFFDMTGAKAKTQGTSNKSYHAELQVSSKDNSAQIYTMWGPTGGKQTEDWRHYYDKVKASKEFESIIKSKIRKGYKEIDIAQRAYGSEEAKQITKVVQLNNIDNTIIPKTNLHIETQRLVSSLMGATNQFVIQTLKCPLGQLTNNQIDEGRLRLNDAKSIINKYSSRTIPNNENKKLEELTNEFYSLIPHNLGSGSRGQMNHLLFDDLQKIMQKEQDLDTLLDAKSVGASLKSDSGIDDQYKSFNADLIFIDHNEKIFKFLENYFHKSANSRHGFSNVKVKNIWKVERFDKEKEYFTTNTEKIAKKCGKHTFEKEAISLCKEASSLVPNKRPDLDKDFSELYHNANVWLCWHGTRSANVVGITKRGLMVRPAGAVHTGSLFGDGKYFAWQSTKSLNYCDGGYWTGRANVSSRFMFMLDVAMGNMHVASYSQFYKTPPKGYHSVYGKANVSGVLNDEMITYDFNAETTQSRIRYLLEIS
jgi:poly [ADP-ribose] polymerase